MYSITQDAPSYRSHFKKKHKKTKEEKKDNRDAAKMILKNPYLLALRPAMKKALDKRGIKYQNKLPDIVEQFYYQILKKKNNFENYLNEEHLAAEIVEGIISGIIQFFKGLKEKKDEGKQLSDTEKQMLDLAEEGANQVEKMKQTEVNEGIGEFLRSPIAIGIGIFIALKVFKVI